MDTIVYFGRRFEDRFEELGRDGGVAEDGSIRYQARGPGGATLLRRIVPIDDLGRAGSYIRLRPVDAVVLDARGPDALARSKALLEELYPHGRMSGPILRQRVLGLVSLGDGGAQAAFDLGRHN